MKTTYPKHISHQWRVSFWSFLEVRFPALQDVPEVVRVSPDNTRNGRLGLELSHWSTPTMT